MAIIAVAVFVIHAGLSWVTEHATEAGNQKLMIGMLSLVLLGYALLIAVPFMPGIEIGISLLILQGAAIAPFVYAATVLGLLLAYTAGRVTPYRWLHGLLQDLRWRRACDFVEKLEPMDQSDRVAHLTARLPERARPWVTAGRYILLAGLLTLPGNAVIGGGGGISFVAGFSRLFSPAMTVVTILIAVLPVPLVIWVSGGGVLL